LSKIEVNTIEPQCGTTLTLGGSGDTVTLGSGASQSGFGRTGTVDWQTTPKTATFTAVNGEGYFINQGSAITMNLPAGSAGAIVAVSDYARNFETYNLTISPNGSEKIGGVAGSATLNVNGQAATFVYVDSTKGWINVQNAEDTESGFTPIVATGGNTVATCGNFKIHTFTGPGTFCVSCAGTDGKVDYLVIAGGGGGGFWYGAGGGAGGYRFSDGTSSGSYTTAPGPLAPLGASALTVTATGFPITVGAGGTGGSNPPSARSTNGSNSVFSTITSTGGGGGGGNVPSPRPVNFPGNPGGSGGGAKGNCAVSGTAGSGNTPPVTPPQGNDAGSSNPTAENNAGGGGAGGASNPASTDNPSNSGGGFGGVGIASCITGSPVGRGGGGSGNAASPPHGNANPTGAPFGGGVSNSPTTSGSSGTANTGGGGGAGPSGGSETNAGSGGSGVVIIRYKFQ
jgi:hypothetical protein